MEDLNNIVLRNWGGYDAKVELDESIDDIVFAMKYEDHGDEFLVVRTLDGSIYEYGLYVTRNGYDDDPESESNKRIFIKTPKMKYLPKDYTKVSNELYDLKYRWLYNEENDQGMGNFWRRSKWDHFGYYSSDDKYVVLQGYLKKVEAYAGENYDRFNNKIIAQIKQDIVRYFAREKLDVDRLDEYNRIVDGFMKVNTGIIAGKRNHDVWFSGDYIQWMIYKGQPVKVKKKELKMKTHYDSWGSRTFTCSIERFS